MRRKKRKGIMVRVGEQVTHIRIQNTGDYYDLYGGEKFATLSELVEYYTQENGILQDKDCTMIELKYPLNCSDPTTERAQRREAAVCAGRPGDLPGERVSVQTWRLRPVGADGGDEQDGGQEVSHIKIMCQNDRYTVGGSEMFDTLTDLVEFYKRKGIEEISGNWVHLKQPYFSTRVNAADIDSRALQKFEAKVKKSREEGQRPENKSKNRYKNILPFNETRVALQDTDPEVVGSDYINANYVKNKLSESGEAKVYIATQGCLATTVNDFWQMAWQENTRNKCVPYWPDLQSSKDYGPFLVTLTSEREATDYKIRLAGPRRPSGARRRPQFPRAGIGRTGTIVVIDMILVTIDSIGLDCDLDIPKYIQMVREQRSGMVQTEAQYKFIYLAVSEYIQTTKAKDSASMETETEYGNLQLTKHQPASRKVSKNKEELYENLSKGKKDVKKSKSDKKSGSVKKR
ncbi:hypothetical protein F7725_017962 [Dissostichus mawsoni]|uniref:protein-tyrosine-phosphatase n=1 Tax=Dissostichus mawsoni TaxID=36200 RepID=A0A7J5XQ51_DISMA|nr:hypothetical protein F7725_017962 [Dissostichus mawsoni]